jgi:hypothetical protein
MVPPGVIACAAGVTSRIGVFFVQTTTLIVVDTVFEEAFAWPAAVAVTDVPVEPEVLPATAVTFRGTVVVAPVARVTGPRLAGTVKFTLFEFVTGRLKVVFRHPPESLLVIVTV